MVKEFSAVFLDDLPKVHPKKEIDFDIDFIQDTRPISNSPYRMKQIELKEQLKDLLDKALIRPSILIWGAVVLFVRKKDVYRLTLTFMLAM